MINPELRWPIILFSIPFAAVLFGIFIVAVALIYPDDVVTDDYYRDGMAINRRISEEQTARQLGVELLAMTAGQRGVIFELSGTDENSLLLGLFHITDSRQDSEHTLVRVSENGYLLDAAASGVLEPRGVWYLDIASAERNWKIRQRITTPLDVQETADE